MALEDLAGLTRAQETLSTINTEHGAHFCAEWIDKDTPEDGCEICWRTAIEVIVAFLGLEWCPVCHSTGRVGPEGDLCPECDGRAIAATADGDEPSEELTHGQLAVLGMIAAMLKTRDGMWVKGAPTHVFPEFLGHLRDLGFVLVRPAAMHEALRLHDDTGDPRDEGYMAALNDARRWLRAAS